MQLFSRFTEDKGPSLAERFIRTIRTLLKKPVFEKGKADWISEPSSVIKQYNNTIHYSFKMTPVEASRTIKENKVYFNPKDKREFRKPKFKLGQLVRTADINRVFSKGDSTTYSEKLYTITEIIHDTIPSYRINYLPERFIENLLLPAKLTREENNPVMKKLSLIQ